MKARGFSAFFWKVFAIPVSGAIYYLVVFCVELVAVMVVMVTLLALSWRQFFALCLQHASWTSGYCCVRQKIWWAQTVATVDWEGAKERFSTLQNTHFVSLLLPTPQVGGLDTYMWQLIKSGFFDKHNFYQSKMIMEQEFCSSIEQYWFSFQLLFWAAPTCNIARVINCQGNTGTRTNPDLHNWTMDKLEEGSFLLSNFLWVIRVINDDQSDQWLMKIS